MDAERVAKVAPGRAGIAPNPRGVGGAGKLRVRGLPPPPHPQLRLTAPSCRRMRDTRELRTYPRHRPPNECSQPRTFGSFCEAKHTAQARIELMPWPVEFFTAFQRRHVAMNSGNSAGEITPLERFG